MKKIALFVLIIIALVIVGFSFFSVDFKKLDEPSYNQFETYSNREIGLEFKYRPGSNGYVIQEMLPVDTKGELVKTIVLIRTEDLDNKPIGGEGAPTITIHVLKNTKKQWPQTWADNNHIFSNINLRMGNITETMIGGANAIRYMADGLYVSDNVVVSHGENVYVITGMFLDQDSDIRRDFEPLLMSLRFIPILGQE